jgi:LysM repeat protein
MVTTANAVPTVDPAHLPSPSPTPTSSGLPTSSPAGSQSPAVGPTSTPSAAVTTAPTPTLEPSPTSPPGPSPTPLSYVVQANDNLRKIAAKFGVTVDAIVELNHIKNPDHIEAGQVLLIPVAP